MRRPKCGWFDGSDGVSGVSGGVDATDVVKILGFLQERFIIKQMYRVLFMKCKFTEAVAVSFEQLP